MGYLKNVLIRINEEDEYLVDKYEMIMKSIIGQAEIIAISKMDEIQRKAQSEILKGNSCCAIGTLNKRYDTLLNECYFSLCKQNNIPSKIAQIFTGWLVTYKKE